MKKIFLALFVATATLISCGDNTTKSAADAAQGDATIVADSTVVKMPAGDIAYLKVEEIGYTCNLFQSEGVALNEKINKAMEGFAQKEKNIQAEVSRVQGEAAKLQEKYQKGLITTADFQQQGQALEARMQKAETNYNNLQTTYQKDAAAMQEELNVLNNRIADYINKAVDELNADGRYKMIIDATMLVDASPELDMTAAVLAKVNELYAADK